MPKWGVSVNTVMILWAPRREVLTSCRTVSSSATSLFHIFHLIFATPLISFQSVTGHPWRGREHQKCVITEIEDRRWCFILDESVRSQSVPGQYTAGGSVGSGGTLPHPYDSWISVWGKRERVLRLRPSLSKIRTLEGATSRQLFNENSRVLFQRSVYWICGHSGKDIIFLRIPVSQFSPVIIIPPCSFKYRGADKSLARPTSRCILFEGENISFDASLVIYINNANIPSIMIINRIYETQNLLSL